MDLWILILLGAGVYIFIVYRTAKLNRDPVQQEIARLLMEVSESGFTEQATVLYVFSLNNLFIRSMIIEERAQNSRQIHALSMLKSHISKTEYERLKTFLKNG